MTAVVGPVCIQYANLGHRWFPMLLVAKIGTNPKKILIGHCQIQRFIQLLKGPVIHLQKTLHQGNLRRLFIYLLQGIRFLFLCDSGIHRVHDIRFHCMNLFFRQSPVEKIGHSRPHDRFLILLQEPKTLDGRVRSLIELSRQGFHTKNMHSFRDFQFFLINRVQGRLCKHTG